MIQKVCYEKDLQEMHLIVKTAYGKEYGSTSLSWKST